MGGVFHNLGRNGKDPNAGWSPGALESYLLEALAAEDELPRELRRGSELSVAIQHSGHGLLSYAVLDPNGEVLHVGTSETYSSCSGGTLSADWKQRFAGDHLPWVGSKARHETLLLVNAEGELLASHSEAQCGLMFIIPVCGKTVDWEVWSPNPALRLGDVEF